MAILPLQLWYQFQYLRFLLSLLGRAKNAITYVKFCKVLNHIQDIERQLKLSNFRGSKPEGCWGQAQKFQLFYVQQYQLAACGWVKVPQPLQQLLVWSLRIQLLHECSTTRDPYAWGISQQLLHKGETDPNPVHSTPHESSSCHQRYTVYWRALNSRDLIRSKNKVNVHNEFEWQKKMVWLNYGIKLIKLGSTNKPEEKSNIIVVLSSWRERRWCRG